MKVAQSCLTLCHPMNYTAHGILQTRILEWIAFPFSRGSSQCRDRTQVSHIAGRFFTIWATRETKNTGVGGLSLLQEIFPTQELDRGLLHCRQILYQLSYQGSFVGKQHSTATYACLQCIGWHQLDSADMANSASSRLPLGGQPTSSGRSNPNSPGLTNSKKQSCTWSAVFIKEPEVQTEKITSKDLMVQIGAPDEGYGLCSK